MPPENQYSRSSLEIEFEQALEQYSPILQEKIDQLKKQLDEIVQYSEECGIPFSIEWKDLWLERHYFPDSFREKYRYPLGDDIINDYINYSTGVGWVSSTC